MMVQTSFNFATIFFSKILKMRFWIQAETKQVKESDWETYNSSPINIKRPFTNKNLAITQLIIINLLYLCWPSLTFVTSGWPMKIIWSTPCNTTYRLSHQWHMLTDFLLRRLRLLSCRMKKSLSGENSPWILFQRCPFCHSVWYTILHCWQ